MRDSDKIDGSELFRILRGIIPNIPQGTRKLTLTIELNEPVRFTCEALASRGADEVINQYRLIEESGL